METDSLAKAAKAAASEGKTGGAVAKKPEQKNTPALFIKQLIEKQKDGIAQALPSVMTPERFTRIVTTAMSTNPKLQDAAVQSPMTLLGAMMTAAQLGVEPNTPLGEAYLIPFNNSRKVGGQWVKKMEVSFQLGVKGLANLFFRSGEALSIDTETVYAKDTFHYELGLNATLKHIPSDEEDRGPATHYYAVVKMKSGGVLFKVWSRNQVLAHAKRFSKSWSAQYQKFSGPWESDFDAMAKKTVLKDCLKYAPMKSEFAKAFSMDDSVKSTIRKDMATLPNEDVIDIDSGAAQPQSAAEPKQQPADQTPPDGVPPADDAE